MKAADFVRCSQPLTYRTDVPGFDLASIGTCFFVKFRHRHWAITATHAFALHGKRADDLVIPRGEDSLAGLVLFSAIELGTDDPYDNAFADLTVFEVGEPPVHESDLCAFDLDMFPPLLDFADVQAGDDVLVPGYPLGGGLENGIDFDVGIVSRQRFNGLGTYVGPDSSRWMHRP
jgi:hypothetical protein